MKAKGILLVVAFALAGSLTVGGIALAQKSLGPTPPGTQPVEGPAQTLSGDDIQPGDPTASDSPIRLIADPESQKAVLPATDLGEMRVEGWSTGEIHALKKNLDTMDVQRQEQPAQTLPGDDVRPGDPTASDSPVRLIADSESQKAVLPSTDLGEMRAEGWSTGEIRAVRENLDTGAAGIPKSGNSSERISADQRHVESQHRSSLRTLLVQLGRHGHHFGLLDSCSVHPAGWVDQPAIRRLLRLPDGRRSGDLSVEGQSSGRVLPHGMESGTEYGHV